MYRRNVQFPGPGNTAVVWRYMPFVAFVDLLQRRKLFFTRLEKLADPYEGFYSPEIRPALEWKVPKAVVRAAEKFSRRNYCVSCWHENEDESAAMWSIYSSSDGIAVRSTVRRLKDALEEEGRDVFIAKVRYSALTAPAASPLAYKRKSFEHEKEVRIWCLEPSRQDGQEHGTYVSVDLATLIEAVFISPTAGHWVTEVVQSTLNLHGCGVTAVQSKLYTNALG